MEYLKALGEFWSKHKEWVGPAVAGAPGVWALMPDAVRKSPWYLVVAVYSLLSFRWCKFTPRPLDDAAKEILANIYKAEIDSTNEGVLVYGGTRFYKDGKVVVTTSYAPLRVETIQLDRHEQRAFKEAYAARYADIQEVKRRDMKLLAATNPALIDGAKIDNAKKV